MIEDRWLTQSRAIYRRLLDGTATARDRLDIAIMVHEMREAHLPVPAEIVAAAGAPPAWYLAGDPMPAAERRRV